MQQEAIEIGTQSVCLVRGTAGLDISTAQEATEKYTIEKASQTLYTSPQTSY